MAKKLIKEKKSSDAEKTLSDFLSRHGSHAAAAEARFLLGQIEARNEEIDRALGTFGWIISNHRGTDWAARSLEQTALLHEKGKNQSSADRAHGDLLHDYPQHPVTARVWTGIADALYQKQKFAEAIATYERFEPQLNQAQKKNLKLGRILAKGEGDPSQLLAAGDEALKFSDLATGISFFEMHLQRFPNDARKREAQTKLGWARYRVPDPKSQEQAEAIWRDVVTEGPPADEWVGRAKWQLVQVLSGPRGEWKKAVAMCDELIATFPKGSFRHEQAVFSKAWLFWVHKQWQPALDGFELLMRDYPASATHAPILEYVSDCREKLGISAEK